MKNIKHNGIELNVNKQEQGQLAHNNLVKTNGQKLTKEINRRLGIHDKDKLKNLEIWARFQIVTSSGFAFGSDEYNELVKTLDVDKILMKHRKENPHHPEYFENDFSKMSVIDLTELASDWYTANSSRPSGTEFNAMLDYQQGVYGFSDDIKDILYNTFIFLDSKK